MVIATNCHMVLSKKVVEAWDRKKTDDYHVQPSLDSMWPNHDGNEQGTGNWVDIFGKMIYGPINKKI